MSGVRLDGDERTGHLLLYAEAEKVKLLALHTHGRLIADLKDGSNSSYFSRDPAFVVCHCWMISVMQQNSHVILIIINK